MSDPDSDLSYETIYNVSIDDTPLLKNQENSILKYFRCCCCLHW